MFKNYFKTAWRNIVRNKALSFIKILRLSIGLTVCILIFLYSKDEITFDRFHANNENIYRVIQDMRVGDDAHKLSITASSLGEAFQTEIPEVRASVRLSGISATVNRGDDVFAENLSVADNNFFSVFSFNLVSGNTASILKDVYSIVLTESTAKKYFGSTKNAIGKILQLNTGHEFENFTVTGIAADTPQNSTIRFDMLIPFDFFKKGLPASDWVGGSLNTFLLLAPQADKHTVIKKMQAIFDKNTSAQKQEAEKQMHTTVSISLDLQALSNIHLNKELGAFNGLTEASSPVYSYVLSSIAFFILLIACINFINLSIGQSLKRSREIGIRKVIGGSRKQLIVQFFTEAFLVSLFAFVLAIIIAIVILPLFNELANKKLSLSYLANGWLYAEWFALLLATSLIAGFYPSIILSGFQPLKVLSGRYKLMGKNYFSKSLIVFQFALAIFLIIGTIAVYAQLNFLFRQSLGYDSSNLVKINLPAGKDKDKFVALFKSELSGKQNIIKIAARNGGTMSIAVQAKGKQINVDLNNIDENYFPAFKIPVIAGRNFSPDFAADSLQSAIINESFAKQAGWQTNEAVGKTFRMMEDNKILTVTGVVKDYHYNSLKSKIEPQVFTLGHGNSYGQLWIKIKPDNIPATLNLLAQTFHKLSPLYPYSYAFMDAINAHNYENETRWKQIISISAILFIFISCIGLFGLSMLSVEQRTKEIGIRKVLGAAVSRIIVLISKEFIILISISFVVAVPVGYYFINKWLQDFAYRINISWWMFAFAGVFVIAIALITISFQAIKAAIANPVKSLRTE